VQIPAVQNSLSSAGKSAGTRFVTRRDRVLIRLGDEDERVIGEALASTQEHWYMSHGTRERRARARIDSIYNAERPQRNKLPSVTHELTIRRSNALRHSSHSSDLMYTTCEHTNTRDASERREPFYFTVRSLLLPSSSPHNTGTPSIKHRNIPTLLPFVLPCSIRSFPPFPARLHHGIEPLCDALCTEDSLRNTSVIRQWS